MFTFYRSFFKRAIIFIIVFPAVLILAGSVEKLPFTVADSLRVKTFNVQSITENGRFIAGLVSSRLDRLGIDHKRYRDPTYLTPRYVEAVILDTETQEAIPLFKTKVQVPTMQWSPDGKKLAFFLRKGDMFFLNIHDREKHKTKEIKLKTKKQIASNSILIWKNDSSGIIITLREDGWWERSSALFEEATQGSVIVYDSREPFLKWDVIRDQPMFQIPAVVDLESRGVKELLPESRYSNFQLAKDDSFIIYVQIYPIKTEYGQNYYRQGGREYELFRLDLPAEAESKVLIERREKRLALSWNEEKTMFAWSDEGDIYVQSVDETEARNMTKGKAKPEEEGDKEQNLQEISDKDEEEKKKVRFSMERWSPDGTKILASTKRGFWIIDLENGKLDMVYEFPEEREGESRRGDPQPRTVVSWSLDGKYLYMTYSATDKWERGFTRYDLQDRRMEDLIKDSNLYRNLQMSKNGQKFFYSFSDGDLPNNLYMTDKEFKEKTQLTELNPWMTERKLTRSELVSYLDVDGNKLYGILYYPVNYQPGKKYPLVCEVYERFFDNGFNSNMNIIANQGWFGLRPSVNLQIGYPGEAWIKGVTSAINLLIERGDVEPTKLGVHGTSYGGYATSLLITQTGRFAAAINISGKVNIISFLGDSPRIGHRNYGAAEAGQDRIGATLWDQPFKYVNHSAVMFADRVKTPHLLITGERDWNVPAGNTREMY
ncbi:prolyl oligopeptidase family serine peptidase [Acidobacteriota bacterium]